jgi:hypothetical protein
LLLGSNGLFSKYLFGYNIIMIQVTKCPFAKTVTIADTAAEMVKLRDIEGWSIGNFVENLTVSNLSSTDELFIGFKSTSEADGEEFTLTPGSTLMLNFNRHGPASIWVRWTAAEKYSLMVF